jgi:hypothetical protein
MTLLSATKWLLVLALALPMIHIVLIWVRGLLTSMGDNAGAEIIGHIGTACLAVWPVSLVGLVVVLALIVVSEHRSKEE